MGVGMQGKPRGSPPIYGPIERPPITMQKIALLMYINLVATIGMSLLILSAVYRLH